MYARHIAALANCCRVSLESCTALRMALMTLLNTLALAGKLQGQQINHHCCLQNVQSMHIARVNVGLPMTSPGNALASYHQCVKVWQCLKSTYLIMIKLNALWVSVACTGQLALLLNLDSNREEQAGAVPASPFPWPWTSKLEAPINLARATTPA